MRDPVDRINAELVERSGWQVGTSLENRVACQLIRWKWTSDQVKQQHRVGKYRVDFAWPAHRVALEVDGWHHRAPEGAAKDARRDAWLRSQGWIVLRIDDLSDVGEQLLRTVLVVRALDLAAGAPLRCWQCGSVAVSR